MQTTNTHGNNDEDQNVSDDEPSTPNPVTDNQQSFIESLAMTNIATFTIYIFITIIYRAFTEPLQLVQDIHHDFIERSPNPFSPNLNRLIINLSNSSFETENENNNIRPLNLDPVIPLNLDPILGEEFNSNAS